MNPIIPTQFDVRLVIDDSTLVKIGGMVFITVLLIMAAGTAFHFAKQK